jgi:hypothetical protein
MRTTYPLPLAVETMIIYKKLNYLILTIWYNFVKMMISAFLQVFLRYWRIRALWNWPATPEISPPSTGAYIRRIACAMLACLGGFAVLLYVSTMLSHVVSFKILCEIN